jgi:sulfur carrier protein ThiS
VQNSGINYSNVKLELPDGISLKELIIKLGLKLEDVEAVFVNNRVVSMYSILQNNDRVAFVPPGTPGPYRVLLGMVKSKKK